MPVIFHLDYYSIYLKEICYTIRIVTKSVVICGMPASGKSRVGVMLSEKTGMELVDLDKTIELNTGKTIAQIFEEKGEDYFRKLETNALKKALNPRGKIISLGGGTLQNTKNQSLISRFRQDGGLVVYLDVSYEVARERIERKNTRPIFFEKGVEYWKELDKLRSKMFTANCDVRLKTGTTDGAICEADVVADLILEAVRNRVVRVVRENVVQYTITIGHNLTHQIPTKLRGSKKVAVFFTDSVKQHKDKVVDELKLQEFEVFEMQVADAEAGKTPKEYLDCLDFISSRKFTRTDAIIGVGGGAVTDLSGFVAATYMRGIKYINVPTSTLAAVDASTGGKTAINLPAGKNLCGAFYEPAAVYVDVDFFDTLPDREYRQGLAEALKMGLLFDSELEKLLLLIDRTDEQVQEIIERSVFLKAKVVGDDLTDNGVRELLNYGHTFGHAIEKLENFKWNHGQAVSVGLVFAANVAEQLGMLTAQEVNRHLELLNVNGLPTKWDTTASFDQMLNAMRVDKKSKDGDTRLVLLKGLQNPKIVHNPPVDILKNAFDFVTQAR
ncbi:3-dehydroquinate synthase [Actinomycetota bacterium]|nr:3-dehydroquinate synthase [Actinomycetota bacterium]